MATVDGKKTGGRKKGTVNKTKQTLLDMIQEKHPGWHPVTAMAELAQDESIEMNHRVTCYKEVAKYVAPQLKAVEHNVTAGGLKLIVKTGIGDE